MWITLEGFFWFPRTLMGFTKISLAFYDQPELLHRINQDLCDYNLRVLEGILAVCTPTFATLAEDMSYNHGPMISEATFDAFIAPYYRQLIPRLQERGIIPIVDTDGDVTRLVPWITARKVSAGCCRWSGRRGSTALPSVASFPSCAWWGTTTRW